MAILNGVEPVTFAFARNQVVIDSVSTDPANSLMRELAQRMHRQRIGSIRMLPGVLRDELADFLYASSIEENEKPQIAIAAQTMRWPHIQRHHAHVRQARADGRGERAHRRREQARRREAHLDRARARDAHARRRSRGRGASQPARSRERHQRAARSRVRSVGGRLSHAAHGVAQGPAERRVDQGHEPAHGADQVAAARGARPAAREWAETPRSESDS